MDVRSECFEKYGDKIISSANGTRFYIVKNLAWNLEVPPYE